MEHEDKVHRLELNYGDPIIDSDTNLEDETYYLLRLTELYGKECLNFDEDEEEKKDKKHKKIVLNVEVDEESSVDKIALELSNLCKTINAYHIACGGTGLIIDDWNILVLEKSLLRM